MFRKVLLIAVTILIVGAGCASSTNAPSNNSEVENSQNNTKTTLPKAPNFSLENYSGETISLSDFAGKPVVLNSWAAWCPFCKKELVDFAEASRSLGDPVPIVAIDRAESLRVAKQYSDELGVTDDLIFLLDPKDSFYRSIGGFSMPETIFVNGDGEIVFHKRGPMDVNEIKQRIQQLINEN